MEKIDSTSSVITVGYTAKFSIKNESILGNTKNKRTAIFYR